MSDAIPAARTPAFEPSHPGAIIRDMLDHERVSATAAAKRIGVTPPTLNNIMRARASISADMALRLSAFCGNSPEFWLRLQEQFDLWHRSRALAPELAKIERLSAAVASAF